MRPITGAEVTLTDGSHVTLLVESATGYANLCRLLTAAHAHTRARPAEPSPPSLDAALVAELNEGLVCLSGCARHGLASRDPNGAAALAQAFGRERFFVELQRPYERGDARRLAALRDLAEAIGVQTVATGDAHAHHPRRAALQDVLVAIRCRTSLDGCEPERRGNHESVLLEPAQWEERFPHDRDAVARTAELAERLEFDLTEDLGYRYPDFSDTGEPAIRQLAGVCDRAFEERYGDANGHKRRARNRLEEELKLIDELGLAGFFLLHWEVLELARECALEVRGGSVARNVLPPGPRARQLGRLDRLLPDRPLARRPGAGRALARPLHQPRAHLGAGHRPRLPARHPREADRRGLRALRPRALGARRELLDLPRAGRDPRRRQGARAAVRRARAARAPDRRQPVPRRRGAGEAAGRRRQAGVAALARLRPALRRDRRPAPAHLAAPGRDGHLDAAAGRARARAARGDGRPAALPVGQGLVRGRRLPEDRPARPRDALGGRGLRRADRRRARQAGRPLAHPARRRRRSTARSSRPTPSASSRSRAARRCSRCCRRCPRTSTT